MASPTGHGGRDHPDYGISGTVQGQSLILDMSELAVRLGSGNYFDRRGVQVYSERFDYGIRQWSAGFAGAGSHLYLCADYVASGAYAVDMACGTTVGFNSVLQAYFPYPYVANLGLEFHVKHYTAGDSFYAVLHLDDGTYVYSLDVKIKAASKELEITTDTSGISPITLPGYITGPVSPFHVIKFRVDIDNLKWIEVMVDTDEYDLRSAVLNRAAVGTNKQMFLYFATINSDGVAARNILDNIIITLDEPG